MDLAALTVALLLAVPPKAPEPECVQRAKALVKIAEAEPMRRRARIIELGIRRDPSVFCGVIDQAFFAKSPEAPPGCDRLHPATCTFPRGIPVAKRLAEESEPVLYLRVQLIATRLKDKGLWAEPHDRLLSTLLLASQIAREEERSH